MERGHKFFFNIIQLHNTIQLYNTIVLGQIFSLGEGNLMRSDFDDSNLFQSQKQFSDQIFDRWGLPPHCPLGETLYMYMYNYIRSIFDLFWPTFVCSV